MKILTAIGVVALLVLAYPLVNEETTSVCHAVERKFVIEAARSSTQKDLGAAMMMGLAGELSGGAFASAAVKGMYPNIPPFAGCLVTYYKMMFDPNFVQQLTQRMRSLSR